MSGCWDVRPDLVATDSGEYGLALEKPVDVIDEEDRKILNETLAPIQKLASEMLINQEALLGKLQKHIE